MATIEYLVDDEDHWPQLNCGCGVSGPVNPNGGVVTCKSCGKQYHIPDVYLVHEVRPQKPEGDPETP